MLKVSCSTKHTNISTAAIAVFTENAPLERYTYCSYIIAEIFAGNFISYILYFWVKVRKLLAYKDFARIQVYGNPHSLYKTGIAYQIPQTVENQFFKAQKLLRLTYDDQKYNAKYSSNIEDT